VLKEDIIKSAGTDYSAGEGSKGAIKRCELYGMEDIYIPFRKKITKSKL
jgi:hypothetical protein